MGCREWQAVENLQGAYKHRQFRGLYPRWQENPPGGTDSRIKIWDAETGEVLKDFKGIGFSVNSVVMSPDEKRIVYGCSSKEVVVMEAESGKVLNKYEEHELAVMSVAISADGKRFVSGSADYRSYIRLRSGSWIPIPKRNNWPIRR